MDKFIIRYKRIVRKLIKNSFPSLKEKKIYIIESNKMPFSAYVYNPFFTSCIKIKVHSRLRGYNNIYLMGVFAHELCHLEHFKKIGRMRFIIRELRLFLSKKAIIEDEKNTDKEAIKKGYAKELYKQRLSRTKSMDKDFRKLELTYLTPKQIKFYAKSIKKW